MPTPLVLQPGGLDPQLAEDVATLDDVQSESVQAGQGDVFTAAVDAGLSQGLNADSLKEALQGFGKGAGAVGGAAVCAATGVGVAFAPVCAAAGAWVGDKIGGVVADILRGAGDLLFDKEVPGGDGSIAAFSPDTYLIAEKRKAILSALSQTGDDKEAVKLINQLADSVAYPPPVKAPSASYSWLLGAPPWVTAPKLFKQEPNPKPEQLGDLDPNQGIGGGFYSYTGLVSWEGYAVTQFLKPFLDAGLAVAWVKDEVLKDPKKAPGDTGADFPALMAHMRKLLLPELDKWVANRVKWILEESVIRRNARATLAVKSAAKRIAQLQPKWTPAQVAKAQEILVRVVKSGDAVLMAQEVKRLSTPGARPDDMTTTKEDSQSESKPKPKPKSSGGGVLVAGLALAAAAFAMSRK